MPRTDRLFDIIQIIQDGKLHRARDIAERLEVSSRTVYRDMDTLVASGIPIEGERGVGYMLREQIFMPPLNLSMSELEALHLGMAIVEQAGDKELRRASLSLLGKITQVTPNSKLRPERWGFGTYASETIRLSLHHMPIVRTAIRSGQKLKIDYRSLNDTHSSRIIRPLQTEYWGHVWTLSTWCDLRCDFREFRMDRIQTCTLTNELFQEETGKTYTDYIEKMNHAKSN